MTASIQLTFDAPPGESRTIIIDIDLLSETDQSGGWEINFVPLRLN